MITEFHFVLRGLRRAPGYAAAVVVLLALGLGSTIAVVSVVDRVLLRPLPFPHPDTLFSVFESTAAGEYRLASYPTVRDWQAQNDVFEGMAYVPGNQLPMRSPEGRELFTAAYPSGDFFPLLGAKAALGRVLLPDDDRRGDRVVVLSHRLWQRRFGGDRDIVGRVLPLGDGVATVVGVMAKGFRLPEWADLWMPLGAIPHVDRVVIERRGNHADSRVIARLRPGVSAARAEEAMGLIASRLAEVYPSEQKDWPKIGLMRLDRYLAMMTSTSQYEDRRPRLVLFLVGAFLVLLVAAANVATLALARGYARGHELAVRVAIGASRARLAGQLVLETGLLAVIGSALGIWFAMTTVGAIQRASPDLLPRLGEVELDARLALVAVGLALLTTIGAGLWPVLHATARPPFQALTAEGNRAGEAPRRRRLQRMLVMVQVGLATMLLIGAGVMLRSFRRVIEQPPGFEPEGLASVVIQPPPDKYPTPERTLELYQRLERAVAAIPGVRGLALTGGPLPSMVTLPGRVANPARPDMAGFLTVAPSYFRVMGIPIVRGESFTEQDLAGPNGKLMVNEAFVRQYWPGQNAIGRSLTIAKAARWLPDLGQPITGTVVGVVGDVRQQESDADPEVYLPYTWNLWRWMTLRVRARAGVEAIRDPVRRALLAVEPDVPMASSSGWLGFQTYEEQLADGRASRRLTTLAIAALSGLTLLLAALGLYAVVAYSVTRRRREIGIRLALGSERGRIMALVLRDGVGVTAIGLGLGLLAGWFGVTLLGGLVFGVAARDPLTFALVPAVLGVVACLAVALPARRAASVPPAEVLRS